MEINTKPYGLVNVDPANIITFENGLPGFEDMQKFVLLGNQEVDEPLVWLQSVDDEALAFVVTQPKTFKQDYHPTIHINELEDLELKDDSEIMLYCIVVVPEDVSKMTANLKAPLVINTRNNKAKQLILNDDNYQIREYILPQA